MFAAHAVFLTIAKGTRAYFVDGLLLFTYFMNEVFPLGTSRRLFALFSDVVEVFVKDFLSFIYL